MLAEFEDQILPTMLAGAEGTINVLSNVAPKFSVDLVRSAGDGDLRTATEPHRRVLSLRTIGQTYAADCFNIPPGKTDIEAKA